MPPLFLIGFMAAGKTSVGRALAQASGRKFVDVDDVIAEAGDPVAALVARDEPEFRRREAAALAAVIAAGGDTVVATGGGAAAFGDNLDRMRSAGLVIALGVDVDEARSRAAADATPRPLLAAAEQLATARAPAYRRAHAVVDTSGRSIVDVTTAVAAVEASWLRLPWGDRDATIVALGDRSYPITIGDGLDGALIRAHLPGVTRIGLVTDRAVATHWLASTTSALVGVTTAAIEVIEVEPGEASKSFAVYERVSNELIARGLDRGSAIVALGGGVVGDLSGFVAATLYRGIPIVQLPTTLVAMTDAAIGGKTAVDVPAGKNLVGAFWQPRLVACNRATLATLPDRERQAGFGELWKYALLGGPALWTVVDSCVGWARDGAQPPAVLDDVIRHAIAYKAAIVGRDERERTGHRARLNLGHTVGHAIEAATGMLHGEAVGLGLVAACRVSAALGVAPAGLETEVVAALRRTGLPADLAPHLTDDVIARLGVDKKRVGDLLKFIVVREVGVCEPVEIQVTELRRILRANPEA